MRAGRPILAGTLVAASLAVTACGSSEPQADRESASPTMLDTGKVERAIARSSMEQRGVRPRVKCPSDVPQKKGMAFSCTAVVDGQSTQFEVTEIDDAGRVRYEGL